MPKKKMGKSHSTRPIGKRPPSWCKYQPEEVEALVVKLAKEGNTPSKLGIILRDQYGVPLVRSLVGKSITQILKENGLAPRVPEDLEVLLRKASKIKAHLERHGSDKYNKSALQIIETRIRNVAEYYKRTGAVPVDWKYVPTVSSFE